MSALSIRNLDPEIKHRLRLRAAAHGRSMEAEVRSILADAVAGKGQGKGFLVSVTETFSGPYGLDLALPARSASPRAADFA
ncbi:hypothetical protein BH23ACT12_BH23ACT12_12800 [soil metagenome]